MCRADSRPWPCGEARLALADEYRSQRVSLSIYLAVNFAEAVRDVYTLHPDTAPDPAALSRRFLGWLPPYHLT